MSSIQPTALRAVALQKTYPGGRGKPRVRALDGLTVDVEAGSVFALAPGPERRWQVLDRPYPRNACPARLG